MDERFKAVDESRRSEQRSRERRKKEKATGR